MLDLYIEVGFDTEAIDLANLILSHPPENSIDTGSIISHALRCKVSALMRMQRLDEAQTTLQQLTKVTPLDLEVRILELQILLKKGTPGRVTEYANQVALDHPNDARFELLKSIAASLTGDTKSAADLVRPLAAGPLVDAEYTRLLVHQLDSVELFDESFSVIQRMAKGNPDRDMKRLWIRRLYEINLFPLIIVQTADLDPAARGSDVEALAIRALALSQLDRRSDASDIVTALEKRGRDEPSAAKWAAALRAVALHESSDPMKTVTVLRDALITSTGNPILLQELGDAYSDAGSQDKALSEWREVTRVAPEWAKPLVRISRALIVAGRPADALGVAQSAQLRAPHDHDVLVSVATASAATLPEGPSPEGDNVLAMIADIQNQFPKSNDLLPLRVQVLAREQRLDEARDAIRNALASVPLPPESVLLLLGQISRSSGLNLESACWTASEKAYGLTPDLAFDLRLLAPRSAQGIRWTCAVGESSRATHPKDEISWRSAWAKYLDISGDPRAKDEWIAIGDGNPNNVKLQWGRHLGTFCSDRSRLFGSNHRPPF